MDKYYIFIYLFVCFKEKRITRNILIEEIKTFSVAFKNENDKKIFFFKNLFW